MKTNLNDDNNLLFRWFCKGLKYFLLTLLGFAINFVIAHTVSHIFGAVSIVRILLFTSLWIWFVRIAVSLFCLFAIAIIFESWGFRKYALLYKSQNFKMAFN